MAKILSADDDLEVQELIKFTLENEGHQVISASDGAEAIEKAKSSNPDLVILDVVMPKFTGFEVCEQLRENPATCLLPIIMLTSLNQVKDRITGIKLGADQYLSKPFEPLELSARVERLLNRTHLEGGINEITGFPGSFVVGSELKKRIAENNKFSIFYLDINGFKYYNRKYGFKRGDDILKLVAGLLRGCTSQMDAQNYVISYLDDDKFIIISIYEKAEELAKKIIESFNATITKQYDETDRNQGFSTVKGVSGEEIKANLLSIAVGVSLIVPSKYNHFSQIMDFVKEMWKIAKSQAGDTYVIK